MHTRFYKIHRIISIKKELGEFYASLMIENFSLALVGIFIPIFLIEKGFSLPAAVLFMIISWVASSIFSPVAARIDSDLGVKHVILYRTPLLVVFYILLIFVNSISFLYIFIAILGGVSLTLYWTSMNGLFVKNADKIHEGEEVGLYFGLERTPAIIAPTVGALILRSLGFDFLFSLAVGFLLLSVIPLFLSHDFKPPKFNFKNFKLVVERRLSLYFFVIGVMFGAEYLVWSLFVYLNFGVLSLGLSASFSGLAMALFTVWFGRISNVAKNRTRLVRLGVVLYSIIMILRVYVTTDLEVILISFLSGLFLMSIDVPIFFVFTEHARNREIMSYVASRSIWQNNGRVLIALILFILFLLIGNFAFNIVFYIIAGLVLLLLLFK
jgi:MFS family permease